MVHRPRACLIVRRRPRWPLCPPGRRRARRPPPPPNDETTGAPGAATETPGQPTVDLGEEMTPVRVRPISPTASRPGCAGSRSPAGCSTPSPSRTFRCRRGARAFGLSPQGQLRHRPLVQLPEHVAARRELAGEQRHDAATDVSYLQFQNFAHVRLRLLVPLAHLLHRLVRHPLRSGRGDRESWAATSSAPRTLDGNCTDAERGRSPAMCTPAAPDSRTAQLPDVPPAVPIFNVAAGRRLPRPEAARLGGPPRGRLLRRLLPGRRRRIHVLATGRIVAEPRHDGVVADSDPAAAAAARGLVNPPAKSRSSRGSSRTSFACWTGVSTLRTSLIRSSRRACCLARLASSLLSVAVRRASSGCAASVASRSSRMMTCRSAAMRHLALVVAGEDRKQPRRSRLVELQRLDDLPGAQRAHPLQDLLAQLIGRALIVGRAESAARRAGRGWAPAASADEQEAAARGPAASPHSAHLRASWRPAAARLRRGRPAPRSPALRRRRARPRHRRAPAAATASTPPAHVGAGDRAAGEARPRPARRRRPPRQSSPRPPLLGPRGAVVRSAPRSSASPEQPGSRTGNATDRGRPA